MTQQLAEATSSWRVRFTVALVLLLAAAGTVFSLQKDVSADPPQDAVVTVDTEYAENFVGQAHTFTFTLPEYVTCESDATPDGVRTCTIGDASVSGVATVSSVTVAEADISLPSTVTVTLNSNVIGSTDVTLLTQGQYTLTDEFQSEYESFSEFTDVTATKVYQAVDDVLEGAGADIVHVDSDLWAESESGNIGGALWNDIDDIDQAIGAPHYVCLLTDVDGDPLTYDPLLTFTTDGGMIEWVFGGNIDVEGVDEFSSSEFSSLYGIDYWSGTDYPCVHFSSDEVGDQSIYAVYDPDGDDVGVPGTAIFASSVGPGGQPLVKEWNSIDETYIIEAIGLINWDGFTNTDELDCWVDSSDPFDFFLSLSSGDCDGNNRDNMFAEDARPNMDGEEVTVTGGLFENGYIYVDESQFPTFIDYVLGSQPEYEGPIDGAEQTYTISGECGSAIIEDPVTGEAQFLSVDGDTSATVLSSDKGVAFSIAPSSEFDFVNVDNANCEPGDTTTITIETEEYVNYDSPLDTAADETVTVVWQGQTLPKQPLLAWSGQRVVLEHNWAGPDGECTWAEEEDSFRVMYVKQTQSPGAFVGSLRGDVPWSSIDAIDNENAIVEVEGGFNINQTAGLEVDSQGDRYAYEDGGAGPNSDCVSTVIYESQDPGEVDVNAFVIDEDGDLSDAEPISQSVAFLVYYMKFEDVELSIVAGGRLGHNDGDFENGNPWDTSTDTTSVTSNVSADVLLRARVQGYVPCGDTLFGGIANCTTRPAGVDSNDQVLPQGRWVFPADWRQLAGGALAEEFSPNYDLMIDPAVTNDDLDCDIDEDGYVDTFDGDTLTCESLTPLWDTSAQVSHDEVVGPVSLLDGWYNDDGLAPLTLLADDYVYRDTLLADRVINAADAPMPPAEVTFNLAGSGFLKEASKGAEVGNNVYWLGENPMYGTHIPAEPWIAKNNVKGGGYEWDSWNNDGIYWFWDAVQTGDPIDSNDDDVVDGYDSIYVYSDNHGEAMVWANGDANLTFDECQDAPGDDGVGDGTVIDIDTGTDGDSAVLCQVGDLVGESTVVATVQYPDFIKHTALASNPVEIDWEWGGHKYVTVEDDPNGQDLFKYVVLHLADRDGYCAEGVSLHPVLGEDVSFVIDGNPTGGIPIDDAALLGTITFDGYRADVTTFDTGDDANEDITFAEFIEVDGECQAWVKLSNSLLGVINIKVTANDPEGTVTWDVLVDFTGESEPLDLAAGWNLVVWPGDAVDPEAGLASGSPDLTGKVSAIYGWIAATQTWLSYFPLEDDIPAELQTLNQLETGEAYWMYLLEAVNDWTVPTDQD